jgi:ribosomal protein L21
MNRLQYLLIAIVGTIGLVALAGAAAKANHHNGQQLLGEKIKTNGNHVIHKKGDYTTSVEVKNGKVAGVHVKHAKNGDVPVKKYKTNKKMAQMDGNRSLFRTVQLQDLGIVYIGYSYIDEYGVEEIYWFPYDMILDGDTGAVMYVPV